MISKVYDRVLDALDIETFLICQNEAEGKRLALQLLADMGLKDIDIVFIEHNGPGARVRARGYIFKPGDHYGWLNDESKEG
jgi:alkyl hydroperoxide reductase subunit AhpF